MDGLFEMMIDFHFEMTDWLSFRNKDGFLFERIDSHFEMRARDWGPSVDFRNDSHLSCHIRTILR